MNRDPQKQPEIHRVADPGDSRSANRLSEQNIVSYAARDSGDNCWAAPRCHRETDHQHNHQVLKDEGRQRQLSADERDTQWQGDANRIRARITPPQFGL